uniref:Uncharacterized protein n=1 Tax=Setaria viridis TaxID=4556 RepID=A0A4U6V0X7_SETVI|nr:hypothetical protein SEVIR_4G244800v2 [Setaria viridis]
MVSSCEYQRNRSTEREFFSPSIFNIDYWTKADLEKAVAEFGRLLVWEEDPNNLARIVAKIRYRMLGGGPADEGQPPDDVEPTLFGFFGYGQPSANAANNPNVPNQLVNQEQAPQWGLWPDGPQAEGDGPFIGPQEAHEDPDVPIIQALPAPILANNAPADNAPGLLNIDLNMAIDDDLGGIENNEQPHDDLVEEPHADDNNQVAGQVELVEVFIPQANGQPNHMVQDEINENDLMEINLDQDAHQEEGHNDVMQLGYVEFLQPDQDPVFAQRESLFQSKLSAEFYRQWVRNFSSGSDEPKVEIPMSWASFFMAQLINSSNFVWAKEFLSSPALQCLEYDQVLKFSIPPKYPNTEVPDCSASMTEHKTVDDKGKDILFEGIEKSHLASSSATPPTFVDKSAAVSPNSTQSASPATPVHYKDVCQTKTGSVVLNSCNTENMNLGQ